MSVIPLEIALRIADIGITSTPSGKTFSGLLQPQVQPPLPLTCAGALIARMSSLVILPPKPVPDTLAKSIPRSAAILRASGVTLG